MTKKILSKASSSFMILDRYYLIIFKRIVPTGAAPSSM